MLATKYPGGEVSEQKAYEILSDYFMAHPEDTRAWMPLYFILKGRDAKVELVSLLRRILPRLEEDEQALAQFPVTLESLRDEVVKFDGLSAMPKTPDASHKRVITGESYPSMDRTSSVQSSTTSQMATSSESMGPTSTQQLADDSSQSGPPISLENWRDVVLAWQSTRGMTEAMINTSMANDVEKHVAVQAYALISGEYSALKRWPYQVWRDIDKFVFPRNSRERTEGIDMTPGARIPFFRDFGALTPFLLKQNLQNFSVVGLAHKLGIKGEDIIGMRRTVNWGDRFFERTLLKHYTAQLNQMQFVVFHMKGLGRELFYDARYRALYFDAEYFGKMPPSYIFHRIMLHLRAVMAGYHAWLFSDLRQGVMPFVEKARLVMQNSLVSTMKSAVGMGLSPGDIVGESDKRGRLRTFFQQKEVGLPEVEALIQGMWRYLYAWQAAETLDFIGLYEAILGVDIATLKGREIRLASSTHPEIRELLAFATRFHF